MVPGGLGVTEGSLTGLLVALGSPLPDAAAAESAWSAKRNRLAAAEKICCGEDIARGASLEQLAAFDLASRWYMAARNRFYGIAGPSPLDLARYPQGR